VVRYHIEQIIKFLPNYHFFRVYIDLTQLEDHILNYLLGSFVFHLAFDRKTNLQLPDVLFVANDSTSDSRAAVTKGTDTRVDYANFAA